VLPSIPPAVLVIWGSMLYVTGRFQEALWWGFVGLAVMWLLDALFLRETMPAKATSETENHESGEKHVRKREGLGVFLVVMIVAFAMNQIPSEGLRWYIPLFLGDNSVVLFGVMTSISTLVIAFSGLCSGFVVDRLGAKVAIATKWSAIPVLAILFPFIQDMILIIAVYAIWTGLDTIDISIPSILIADEYSAEHRASALGTFSMGVRFLSMTGPAIIVLALILGPVVPFLLKALMDVCGLVLIFAFLGRKRANDL